MNDPGTGREQSRIRRGSGIPSLEWVGTERGGRSKESSSRERRFFEGSSPAGRLRLRRSTGPGGRGNAERGATGCRRRWERLRNKPCGAEAADEDVLIENQPLR